MIDPIGSPLLRSTPESQGAGFVGNLAPAAAEPAQPTDFASMLSNMISDTVTSVRSAESTSLASVHGKASIQQVAEAVLAAEMTLQGAIAVRDKITAAYLELSRMAI